MPDASRSSSHSRDGAGEGRQVEEEVLGLDERRDLAVDPRMRLDEVGGVELVAAVVALVAAGLAVAADRAGALDVAVGQCPAGRRADRAAGGLLDHVAVAPVAGEQLLRDGVVVEGRRPREEVVGQPEVGEVLGDDPVVAVRELARAHALLVGLDEDRRPVLVGSADHEDVVAGHPHVAAEDVGRHPEPGHVADVAWPVGVGPGDGGQDMSHTAQPMARPPPTFPSAFPLPTRGCCEFPGPLPPETQHSSGLEAGSVRRGTGGSGRGRPRGPARPPSRPGRRRRCSPACPPRWSR